jgi:ornithine cyclodeaminase/alanine dehydrogenase
VGFIGCGVQARKLLEAHRALYSGFRAIMADVSPEAAEKFAREAGGFVGSMDQAGSCDIICTSTPSRGPVLHRSYVGISTHINAMGADAPGKQELDPRILLDAYRRPRRLRPGDRERRGERPAHTGAYRREQIYGTLGEIVAGKKPGRTGPRSRCSTRRASRSRTWRSPG